jgi:hypothetical protein
MLSGLAHHGFGSKTVADHPPRRIGVGFIRAFGTAAS